MADEAELIRQYRKLMSELEHNEEELNQPENQHVVAQQLFPHIKSPKPLCLDAEG